MTPISTRYAPHLLALIALVAIPAFIHETGRSYHDDCLDAAGLNEGFDFGTPQPVEQREERLNRNIVQWTEGVVELDPARNLEMEFVLARSFRPSNLYLGLSKLRPGFIEPEEIEVREIRDGDAQGEYRVMLARDHLPIRIAVTMTIYDHVASANPIGAQLATAVGELFSSLRPMTMFFLFAEVAPQDEALVEERAREWMTAALHQYRAACLP